MLEMLCENCGSKKITIRYDVKDFKIFICEDCGLVFTDPYFIKKLNRKELYSISYFKDVHPSYFAVSGADREFDFRDPKIANFKLGLELIKKHKSKGKLLDIGCATGLFLRLARNDGFDVVGAEISDYASDYARKHFELKVRTGSLEDINFDNNYFDVVTMWDFIEHSSNPKAILKRANQILKKDGLLFILTIDEDGFMPKLADIIYRISFGLISWPVKKLHPIHHCFHFSNKTLASLLKRTNFSIIYVDHGEIPIENIEGGLFIKTVLRVVYFITKKFGGEYEVKLLAKKVGF